MSNLTLKSTNYAKMVAAIKAKKGGQRGMIRLGPNTEAHMIYETEGAETIGIFYHGNQIATLDKSGIMFTNAGWGTSTTRNRLGIIARDNDVPLLFGQKYYAQTLHAVKRAERDAYRNADLFSDMPLPERHLITDSFRSIIWNRKGDFISSAINDIEPFYL